MKILYECGICSCYHPWNWDGDCRDDENRYGDPEEYAAKLGISPNDVEVRTMEERVQADMTANAKRNHLAQRLDRRLKRGFK